MDTAKVHCCVLELMSRQILEQITAEEIIQYKTFQFEDLYQLYIQNLRKERNFIGQLQAGKWGQGDIIR